MLKTYTEEFTDTINRMHTVIFSCERKQIQMGRVGRPAACLDSTQKRIKDCRENRCEKRGRISTQTSALQGWKSATSCREIASLLFHYTPLHSAGEKLEFSADQYKEDSITAIFFGCYCYQTSKV